MLRNTRILIVDDHPTNVAILEEILGGCPRISTSGSLNPSVVSSARPDGWLPWPLPCLRHAIAAPQRHDALRRAISSPQPGLHMA